MRAVNLRGKGTARKIEKAIESTADPGQTIRSNPHFNYLSSDVKPAQGMPRRTRLVDTKDERGARARARLHNKTAVRHYEQQEKANAREGVPLPPQKPRPVGLPDEQKFQAMHQRWVKAWLMSDEVRRSGGRLKSRAKELDHMLSVKMQEEIALMAQGFFRKLELADDIRRQKVGGDWRFTVQLDTPFVNVMSKEIKKIKLVPANLTALVDLT